MFLASLLIFFCFFISSSLADDGQQQSFYELLGVAQDADLLAIRKAFKRLAIQKHPDKNPDDPNAHSNFVRINRAYEVLKDEELRRKYDQFGEKGLEDGGAAGAEQYQSWQFYRDNFGIYDDDPEVITLSRADFHEEVFQSGEIWFVNFYSAYCSHCHLLAPAWRELAKQVPEGVGRIGAVNCAEDPALCQSQRVRGYPSLVLYPRAEFFQGAREVSALLQFLLSRLPAPILHPSSDGHLPIERPLLIEFCSSSEEECLTEEDRKKMAAIGAQLQMAFALVDCPSDGEAAGICIASSGRRREGIFFLGQNGVDEAEELFFADFIDLRHQLLAKLPPLAEADAADVDWLLQRAPDADAEPTLSLLFADQHQMDEPEWRRLGLLFPELALLAVPCHRVAQQCAQMHAGQMPRAALFRPEGGFDMDYGGNANVDVRRVAKFVRQSTSSPLIVLDAKRYWEARHSGELWLIDFFAPWCPPCLRLLSELRKLPANIGTGQDDQQDTKLRIGTVNCEAHKEICQAEGVNSYPRTVLQTGQEGDGGQQQHHQLVGFHTADQLLEFITDSLSPSVEPLHSATFDQRVHGRAPGQLVFVDFFVPWCGPCQQLAPEFRRLARQWATGGSPEDDSPAQLSFGSVDCELEGDLCGRENVRSFPTLRLYRHNPELLAPVDYPPNWWRNAQTMAHWLGEMMPSRVQKLASDFANTVLDSHTPFLVDFYAPWCSHCVQFAPTFERVAKLLEGQVHLGKVDCERFGWICQSAGVSAFPTISLYFGTDGGRRQPPIGMAVAQHGQDAEKIAKRVRELVAADQQRRRANRDEL